MSVTQRHGWKGMTRRPAGAAALVALLLLAPQAGALAQGTTALADCQAQVAAPDTDDTAILTPQRGWQMEGRDVEIAITSAKVTADTKPLVCFRWKLQSGQGKFVPVESARVVQRSSGNLKVAATVPSLGNRPARSDGVYTPDNAAPYADVRVLLVGQDGKPVDDVVTTVAVVGPQDYCNVPNVTTRIDSGTIVPSVSKNWQPVGGEIDFQIKTAKTIPSDALIKTCFRWKLTEGDPGPLSNGAFIRVLEREPNTVKVAVTIPHIPNQAGRFGRDRAGSYAIPYLLVPQVDVRVLLFDPDLNVVVDAWTKAGVTSVWFAAAIAAGTVGVAFLALWQVTRRRFTAFGKTNPLLCLITTRSGFASLSQFQITLWTFVVIASAAYVIALSGDLIPITTGTLVLLGISGTASVISKAKSENDAAGDPPPVDPAAANAEAIRAEEEAKALRAKAALASDPKEAQEADAAAKEAEAKAVEARAKADAAEATAAAIKRRAAVVNATDKAKAEQDAQDAEKNAEDKKKIAAIASAKAAIAARIRHPLWSDLVMEEIKGRELDITRVQMLFFTLVTATFVALKVITSYEIPVIPEGFLILMGISNSVYVGSKFANNSAAK